MKIDEIREHISEKLQYHEQWGNELDNTNPGHYGLVDWDFTVDINDIWVDVPNLSFNFKDAAFTFTVILGDSKDGIEKEFSKIAKGQGTFHFNGNNIEIENLEIDVDLDLFA